MTHAASPSLAGVFPVLPTPFDGQGRADAAALRRLVRYLLHCGVDGMTYPGVASEVGQLADAERDELMLAVLAEVGGRVPVVVGASSADQATTLRLARSAAEAGASALMIAAPAFCPDARTQAEFFQAVAAQVPGLPLMLQNVPPPVGAGLDPEVLLAVLEAVPAIAYVKEEALPSGQRLTAVLARAPRSLRGVLGGAGGRYITDELRRGACGTMPAIELSEVHVALFAAHRRGDAAQVRALFTRMLPVLNMQAVFRWALTKEVLALRGLLAHTSQRSAGPRLDALDRADLQAFLADLTDLLPPLPTDLIRPTEDAPHGAA